MGIKELIEAEGWEITGDRGKPQVRAYGEIFPLAHPHSIYSKLYREETNPERKFEFMKKLHHLMWPEEIITWNYWTERRYKRYCEGWRIMSWASGSSTGKSVDGAKLGVMDWLADPEGTGIIVASTTLLSLEARVYGYVLRYLKGSQVKCPYQIVRTRPPKIVYHRDDSVHCISALAAVKGTDSTAIGNYIGRHPKRKMILILDEGTDLEPTILNALANLESGGLQFQCIVIGNSSSKNDLHGLLSTPKGGWDSVSPDVFEWETTQHGGLCQYFSPYDSPAIHEKDPVKKKALERFLITSSQIEEKKAKYGENSEQYWRMVLGWWRPESTAETLVTEKFLKEYRPEVRAEFGGIRETHKVGGLDPAFSSGGDQCILRLAVMGADVYGNVVIDFKGDGLLYRIAINPQDERAAELQIADKVIEILTAHRMTLSDIAIDATGQGRALGELIRLRWNVLDVPLKIYTTVGNAKKKSFDVIPMTSSELWLGVRDFIQTGQVRGLDNDAMYQFATRIVNVVNGKIVVESKPEYKARMSAIDPKKAKSPDEADGCCLALQAAIRRYGFSKEQKVVPVPVSWEDRKLQEFLKGQGIGVSGGSEEGYVRGGLPTELGNGFQSGLEDIVKYGKPF